MKPGHADDVARLFAASDRTDLPRVLGVARRSLYTYGEDLYFHLVEFDGPPQQALDLAAGRADFARLSDHLSPYVVPYDPQTWQSPRDALAKEFYSWAPDGGVTR
jgi:hypothetical protein